MEKELLDKLDAHGEMLREQGKKIDNHSEHIIQLQKDVVSIKNDVAWLKGIFKSLDRKIWAIVIVTITSLVTLITALLI